MFLYILAVAAQRYEIIVHSFCVLSNHAHLILTDPAGRLPAFMQYLDSLVARALNASLGRFEAFWSSDGSYSAVLHGGPEDILAKTAYVLANPVAAGLVQRACEWPGLWTSPGQIGTAKLVAHRPKTFFCDTGYMPVTIELALTTPPGFESAEFRDRLAAALAELEARQGAKMKSERRSFLGAARVLAQRPTSRPAPGEPRFKLNPRVAAQDKWRRIEVLSRLKSFLEGYRDAWRARKAGVRNVIFPAGTYLMRVLHGAQCAEAA